MGAFFALVTTGNALSFVPARIGTAEAANRFALFMDGAFGITTFGADDLPMRVLLKLRRPLPMHIVIPRGLDMAEIREVRVLLLFPTEGWLGGVQPMSHRLQPL